MIILYFIGPTVSVGYLSRMLASLGFMRHWDIITDGKFT